MKTFEKLQQVKQMVNWLLARLKVFHKTLQNDSNRFK